MERGYIKLHRKIDKWEWYDHPNTFRLFIHCLIKANHKTKNWRGNVIKRGQFITSYAKLSAELNISVRQIRTALKNLTDTGEITHKNNNQNGIITVREYDNYQSSDIPVDTPKKEDINDINEEKGVRKREGDTPVDTQATHKRHTSDNNEEAFKSYKNEKKASVSSYNFKKEDILNYLYYKTELITNFNRETKEKYKNLIAECPGSDLFEKVKPMKSYEYMEDYEVNMFVKEVYKKRGCN